MRMIISLVISFFIILALLDLYSRTIQPQIDKMSKIYAEQIIKNLEGKK